MVVRAGVSNGGGVMTLRGVQGWSVEVSGEDEQYVATLFNRKRQSAHRVPAVGEV